ncbi:hypothetical protein CLAFUW4_00174 [Fulvia fulva]|uniref:Uncharacterized protein n=1 Tax=Passalora fulva TaxID=5499 RepID=A0A9Q8P3V5_PASFU|nr:uncharacterized protein CLAFUR5_00173 [Fulvia fulva]KAK4634699.1 hypothetical protein CLAFUR4_00174 [Fulvia fulva]KAK4637602.1 hypothetical protein CLAFUR0_00173 [Fulvia fulva]UJO12420.1 hypothetical protein CLAFUR5_00173 [Fulvia fulva]WPV10201.1 hypothetical protein CLAFUW4_00174 [Fulvia fulva]WPV24157.1 hypothetical protein CLAFUW7_00175 [Fulvia fulva]
MPGISEGLKSNALPAPVLFVAGIMGLLLIERGIRSRATGRHTSAKIEGIKDEDDYDTRRNKRQDLHQRREKTSRAGSS